MALTRRYLAVPAGLMNDLGLGNSASRGAVDFPVSCRPLAPVSTAVLTPTPTFRWTSAKGATDYQVEVMDANMKDIVTSGSVKDTSWTCDKPLPEGVVLYWQVTANKNGIAMQTAPSQDSSPQFIVLKAQDVKRLTESKHGKSPLAQALIDANAGAFDAAQSELAAIAAGSPDHKRALEALAELHKLRNPGD
jgi:hypothetical protein